MGERRSPKPGESGIADCMGDSRMSTPLSLEEEVVGDTMTVKTWLFNQERRPRTLGLNSRGLDAPAMRASWWSCMRP